MPDLRRRLVEHLAPVAGGGVLLALLATTWTGLWDDPPTGTVVLVTLAGVSPALIHVSGVRRAAVWSTVAAALAAVVILAGSVHSSPIDLIRGDDAAWSAVGAIVPDGLGNAATTPLPLDDDETAPLSALLLIVLGGAAALISWQTIVARRALAAVISTATGLAYRWTLIPPGHAMTAGLVALTVILIAFRLTRRGGTTRRPAPGRALAGGMAVVVLATIASAGMDRAPTAWWDWKNWTFGGGQSVTSLSLDQEYGPLEYPDVPVVVARVEAEEAVPLRAAALEDFNGLAFTGTADVIGQRDTGDELVLRADERGETRLVAQKITLGSARSTTILAGGRLATARGLGERAATVFTDGSVRVRPALGPKAEYEVESLVPDPGAPALVRSGNPVDVEARLLTVVPGRGMEPVVVPAWNNGSPQLDPNRFGQYREVYALSREIIGDASTMYGAVNRVEAWVRRLGYDVTVDRPVGGVSDLANFLLVTKRGYCQHFAGSMALMLRMNGIPARVAVGFTTDSSRFDRLKSSYEFIDRDAHSWVEVEFPGIGWIPFDPTPGRSVPNSASLSSPAYSSGGIEIEDPAVATAPVNPTRPPDLEAREPVIDTGSAPVDDSPSSWTQWWWAIAGLLATLALTPLSLKALRRARRRRGDARARVLGATRELESFLTDLGRPPDPAASATERGALIWRDLGFDAKPLYGMASAARFGHEPPPETAARDAWRSVRAAKRSQPVRRRLIAALRLRSLLTGSLR